MTMDRLNAAVWSTEWDIACAGNADDWPKEWYFRFGFARVGTWAAFKIGA